MPAISIILPLYNGEPYIRHTIARIRQQAFQDWELLVIDDGSLDHGWAAAMEEARKDSRIQVFQKPNGGISSARNYGLSKAAGTYIAFADQDDVPGRSWLMALHGGMAGNVDLAVGGKKLEVIDASGKTVKCRVCRYGDALLETEKDLNGFLFNQENDASSQHVWNCLYKKELIEAYGIRFDESLAMGMEDVLFNICYGHYCRRIHKIPQVVYSYKQRIGISTSTKYNPDAAKEYAHRMAKISELFGFPSESDAYRMYADYALRELCNLYLRCRGPDSPGLLAGLRDAYVKNVPNRVAFSRKRSGRVPIRNVLPREHPGKALHGTTPPGRHPGKALHGTTLPGRHPGKALCGTTLPGRHPGKALCGTTLPRRHPGKALCGKTLPGRHPGKALHGTTLPGRHLGKAHYGKKPPGERFGKISNWKKPSGKYLGEFLNWKMLLRKILYYIADVSLRKERYFFLKLLKRSVGYAKRASI